MLVRSLAVAALAGLLGCAHAPPVPEPAPPSPPPPDPRPGPEILGLTAHTATVAATPVGRGELPWWHDLDPGIYAFEGSTVVLAVGRSADHHHIAEGYLRAKVLARLGVRKAAEPVGFSGTMPEPEMSDLFITRAPKFFVLYEMPLPPGAELSDDPRSLRVPAVLDVPGRRRVGRHIFEGRRHLYLECDVEGPVANPDWGRTRATAMWTP